MENNEQKEITVPAELNAVETLMQRNYESYKRFSNPKCSICKVPAFIKKEDEECYRPSVIAIGPVFYNDSELQTMQQYKWICLESFLKLPNNSCPSLDRYINIVREMDKEIRMCYEESSMIPCSNDEFTQMIILDAVFLLSQIIGLILDRSTVPKKVRALSDVVQKDLILLENQLPFFVLERIFEEAFPTASPTSFVDLTKKYLLRYCWKAKPTVDMSGVSSAHLLDFCWKYYSLPYESEKKAQQLVDTSEKGIETFAPPLALALWGKVAHCCSFFLPQPRERDPSQVLPEMTAKQLFDAGVTFKPSESENPLSITFNSNTGELYIPQLVFFDDTEAEIRSVLVFEWCHYSCEDVTYFSDFFAFLNKLIGNEKDFQILQEAGILENNVGSNEEVLNIFKKFGKYVVIANPMNYSQVTQQVEAYAKRRWNQWKAILRRDYFNHPWAFISFIYAVILFILTVLQTITGFKNK